MHREWQTLKKVMIVGGGQGGLSILKILKENKKFNIVAVIDKNEDAPGILEAKRENITIGKDWRSFLSDDIDIVFEVTGKEEVFQEIREARSKHTVLIPGSVAYIIADLLNDKQTLIQELRNESYKDELIFNAINDGMIVVNASGVISVFNQSAEKITGISKHNAIGKHILQVIPSSRLPRVMETKRTEINQELTFHNGTKVITTRIPIIGENGEVLGALAVFKDITEIVNLAEEITNLKEIQMMLEAIIQSSDDAISVVDEEGKGILINRAYTRLTGLSEEEVIGKPATIDIYEGESMHMKVLQTRRPVRGAKMIVGPNKKEVVVNVAPVIVNGKLKGSVGVIHDMSEIQALNKELTRARQIIRKLEAKYTFEDIIGKSDEMILAIEQAKLGAKTPATVLLRGESGTGKELFAHAIHNASDRKFNKFIRVNCASLSESLLESELFGYEEGAFSGAKRGGKKGLFEEANNGSIFLDEIGELSASTQAKLLRVLQEQEIIRVGGTKAIPINVRVIAATNVNLEKNIVNGQFREDLFHRLNRMPIQIPPLRNRKEDIPLLCERLIQKINQDYGRNVEGVTNAALNVLKAYDWPGNVRELENILGRAIIFMKFHETMIDIHHLPDLISHDQKNHEMNERQYESLHLQKRLDAYEKEIILEALKKHQGNKTNAAKELGISIRNLYYKIDKYQIET